jgi:hypothetical protein
MYWIRVPGGPDSSDYNNITDIFKKHCIPPPDEAN